jgi:hypothetical protein
MRQAGQRLGVQLSTYLRKELASARHTRLTMIATMRVCCVSMCFWACLSWSTSAGHTVAGNVGVDTAALQHSLVQRHVHFVLLL